MGLAKRARLSAALSAPDDPPPAADLSTICIVRRQKGPAPVIALADSRAAADGSAKPAGDGMFYKKGNATAATFRPAYWTYEPDPTQLAGPVASLERQLDARRRSNSPSTAPIEAKPEEKPLASLDAAPAIRKLAPATEPLPPLPDPPTPTRAPPVRAELDTEAVEALLRPMPDTAAPPEEVRPTPAVVEVAPSTPAAEAIPPLAPSKSREEPAVLPADLNPPDDPPLDLPLSPPPSVEVPVAPAPSPPASASVASETAAPSPTVEPETERSQRSAAPARKRPSQEAPKRTEQESAEFDALGATIESVLASRWYGGERSGLTAGRVSRSDIAPVTPSGLIAELATVRKEPEPVAAPSRGRRGRIIAAFFLVTVFALAFAAALHWRTGYGSMLPARFLPALFGAAPLPETTLVLADFDPEVPERATRS